MPSTPAYALRKDHSRPGGSDSTRILISAGKPTLTLTCGVASPEPRPNTPVQTPRTTVQNCVFTTRLSTIPPLPESNTTSTDRHVCSNEQPARHILALAQSAAGRLYSLRH